MNEREKMVATAQTIMQIMYLSELTRGQCATVLATVVREGWDQCMKADRDKCIKLKVELILGDGRLKEFYATPTNIKN
jgi:hypothetical protein